MTRGNSQGMKRYLKKSTTPQLQKTGGAIESWQAKFPVTSGTSKFAEIAN